MSIALINGNVLEFIGAQQGKRVTFTSGTVRFHLVLPPRTNQNPVDSKTGLTVPTHYDVPVEWTGKFQVRLQTNDSITPDGTVYSFSIMVPNINHAPRFYSFNGPGPFNLASVGPAPEQTIEMPDVLTLLHRIKVLEAEVRRLNLLLGKAS